MIQRYVKLPVGYAQFYQAGIANVKGGTVRSLEELQADAEDVKLDGFELVEMGVIIKEANLTVQEKAVAGLMIYGYRPDEIRKKLHLSNADFRRIRIHVRNKLKPLLY